MRHSTRGSDAVCVRSPARSAYRGRTPNGSGASAGAAGGPLLGAEVGHPDAASGIRGIEGVAYLEGHAGHLVRAPLSVAAPGAAGVSPGLVLQLVQPDGDLAPLRADGNVGRAPALRGPVVQEQPGVRQGAVAADAQRDRV